MCNDEIWKPVPSLQGVTASSYGRIKLPEYERAMPRGGKRMVRTKPTAGSVTTASKKASHKYRSVYNRRLGNLKIHRLVCEAFHGPPPFDGAVVLHLDENGLNNKPENLKWGTQKENLNAPGFIEYCKSRTGENSPTIKSRNKQQQ